MGEGKGMENVSKDIEFEEQVLGTMDEERQDDGDAPNEKDGLEMENDFDGNNFDKDKPEDENQEEQEKNEKDENELDDEFSSVDDNLDHKMWKDDAEEDEEKKDDVPDEDDKEEDPMRREEELEFHGEEQEGISKAKEKPQEDKTKKRNVEDYKEVENEKEISENNEEEVSDFEEQENKEPEKRDGGDEVPSDVELDDDLSSELKDENPADKSLSFESEGEAGEEEIKDEQEQANPPEEQGIDEEKIEDQNKPNEADGEKIDEEKQDENEEEKNPENNNKTSNKNKMKENKLQTSKGPQNSVVEEDEENKNQDKKESGGDTEQPNKQKEKQSTQNKKTEEEPSQSFEEVLKKFIQENTQNQIDLNNFIRDLNIDKNENNNNNEEKKTESKALPMQDENARDLQYEIVEEQSQFESQIQTNAPSGQMHTKNQQSMKENKNSTEEKNNQDAILDEGNQDDEAKDGNEEENTEKEKEKTKSSSVNKKMQGKEQEKNKDDQIMENILNKKQEDLMQVETEMEETEEEVKKDQNNSKEKKDKQKPTEMNIEISTEVMNHEDYKSTLNQLIAEWKTNSLEQEKGIEAWNKFENAARHQAMLLCEELKAVLAPTEIASMKGDYKSGKRLNMKKIIPYIASNYRKDKIWLRRSDPTKRKYQIMLAIDDSLSMSEQNVGFFALESMTMMALAMSKLEVGQIAIAKIDDNLKLLHPFDVPLTSQEGPYILSQFSFKYNDSTSADLSLYKFMKSSIHLFKEFGAKERGYEQICFILSDGRFNKNMVRNLLKEAEENNQLYIFIILDAKQNKNSILNIKSTEIVQENGKSEIKMFNYLDDFPFKYYLIVKDITLLPSLMISILRQYLERNQ